MAETNSFPLMYRQLLRDYGRGRLMDVVSVDAGYTSLANATLIHESGRGYLFALKKNQPELWQAAVLQLGHRMNPDATTPWERYRGRDVRRFLFRDTELAGWNGWSHLRQVWRVVTEYRDDDGQISRPDEDRYFLTNLTPGRTQDDIPLRLVRAHWGIENNCNWTLDTHWLEDEHPWCSRATAVISLLRLLAYNVLTRLRARRLRSQENRSSSWAWLRQLVVDCFVIAGLDLLLPIPSEPSTTT